MTKYELTLILEAKVTSAKKKSILESLEKVINLLKGRMGKVEDWGVKEMFHEIKGNKEGLYLHLPVEMDPKNIRQFSLKLKTDDNILRHLIVKYEKS